MAACSSFSSDSNPTPRWRYHVFLSFRGEDTRYTFTDHLYNALWRRGIITFRDDEELEKGEVIKEELLQAIKESLSSIVIVSQNYASSSWCLEELRKILESRKTLGRTIFPIFYGVDPSDLRYQRGSFAEAFRRHEERFGEDSNKVQSWKQALSEVANLSGYHSKNWLESELIEEIITALWTKLEPNLPRFYDDGFVGIDTKIRDMCQILEIGSREVRFVGIWGMGGIGKTTLARIVFNLFRSHFDISCCLENIREKSSAVDGLLGVQIKLLSKLGIGNLEIDNLDQGQTILRNLLPHRKVLLLLDDVDDIGQLEHLAGKQDWFGQGSRVIVTTRNMHLLESHDAPFSKYIIGALNTEESLELFCNEAFKANRPKEGYEELSQILVQYCQGLPLALKVLGSYLYGRDVLIWEDAFKKIKKDPPKSILDTLRISFEGLEEAEKTLFLDIACFFKGWDINRVMQIFEICGFNPKIGIEILIERSLLMCDGVTFEMHDLLQEMGRKIVIQKSNNEINKQSRLWSPRDVNEGIEFIEGIVLSMRDYETCWGPEAFSMMSSLRILIIFQGLHLQLPLGLKCLSNSIKVLEWSEYPLQSLPLGVKLERLVQLKLHRSKIKQLWNGSQNFENLKFIDLSYSEDLTHTPNFSGVPNLESLILEGCLSLVKIHQSVGQLKKLVVLNLKDCINLEYLPSKLETTSLKDLNLCGCSKVRKLLKFMENMKENKSMETLDLSETAITEVPSLIGEFRNLKCFSVRGCTRPVSKPWWKLWRNSISMDFNLPSLSSLCMLRKLDVSYCNLRDESVPDLSYLSSLEILRMSGNNFRGNSILTRLKSSQFSSGLSELIELELNNCGLNDGSILDDLRYLPSLEVLSLSGNDFVDLPPGCISNLSCLWALNINCCSKLQSLPMFPPSLLKVRAENCGLMEALRETQIWRLLMCDEVGLERPNNGIYVSISVNEISTWFNNQKDCSSIWKFDEFQDSITINIPDCCHSSPWWGIVFCIIVEPPNNADLHGQRLSGVQHWCLYTESTLSSAKFSVALGATDYKGFNRNRQIIFLFDGTNYFPINNESDGCNQFQMFFGVKCNVVKDGHIEQGPNLNISKCGWRVICTNEIQQNAAMSDFENVPSNSEPSDNLSWNKKLLLRSMTIEIHPTIRYNEGKLELKILARC